MRHSLIERVSCHAWVKLILKSGSLMTLLNSLALLMSAPLATNLPKSVARVESVLNSTGPRADGDRLRSFDVMVHHRQQCFPFRVGI